MIYFILDEDRHLVKIGYTASDTPEGRLRAFQTGNPARLAVLATMPGEMADEQALHRHFASERVAGEWFRPCAGIFKLVAAASPRPTEYPRYARNLSAPLTFYLAGKIGPRDWRHTIVRDMEVADDNPGMEYLRWPVQEGAIFGTHSYSGPFFLRHDGSLGSGRPFGPGNHGSSVILYSPRPGWSDPDDDGFDGRLLVNELCQVGIDRSDVVFAWIDSPDCYGTITEIGLARSRVKEIWIAGPHEYPDMWFPYACASLTSFGHLDPLPAFLEMLGLSAPGHHAAAVDAVRADPELSAFYRLPAL